MSVDAAPVVNSATGREAPVPRSHSMNEMSLDVDVRMLLPLLVT